MSLNSLNKNFINYLLKILPISNSSIIKNEVIITIPLIKILSILTFFKYHTNCQYKILTDICVIDYSSKKKRLTLRLALRPFHLCSLLFCVAFKSQQE